MWRWTKRIVAGFCGLLIAAALAGAIYDWVATRRSLAATPHPGTMVDVGGHRLHIWCTGTGTPPVILETGLGGSSVGWGFVQPEVARFTRVCSYDRAGMGYSDLGPSPRTARRIAHELAELLSRSGIVEPAILVGASSGGLIIRAFASEHTDRVAGLVLVDASHEDQNEEVPSLAPFVPVLSTIGVFRLMGVSFDLNPDSLAPAVRPFARATAFRSAGYRAAADELRHMRESGEEVRAMRRKLTVPVVVVTGGRGANAGWMELQRDQTTLSESGCQIIAERSGHVVPTDQPEILVSTIAKLVDAARGRKAGPLCGPPAR